MKRGSLGALLIVGGLVVQACATTFTGAAHIEGGREGCERQCSAQKLEMSGLVYLGEYSSACVCSVPKLSDAAATQPALHRSAASASAAAVAGVMMQMQELQRQDFEVRDAAR